MLLFLSSAAGAAAATRYVCQSSPGPAPPYTNWTTAAHVIQDAVDAAQTGDTVLAAGGVYATGGRAVYGSMTNRVAVDRAITVESLMGPAMTIIQGYQVPGTTNGDAAIRCVYLANGATLSGFTLTNGATRQAEDEQHEGYGGGVWCESATVVVSNCIVVDNSAYWNAGGVYRGRLINCTLTGNSVSSYGGATDCATLNNCMVSGNSAYHGGGASGGILSNCTVTGNAAGCTGGGVCGAALNSCTVTGNLAYFGGGAALSTLNRCTVTGNSAAWDGGGTAHSTLNNCIVSGNFAERFGGGTCYGTLNNCTLTGNEAADYSGAYLGRLNNCIVYYNFPDSAEYSDETSLNYCCTALLPADGEGNLTDEPRFVDPAGGNLRLQSNSPCINAGTNTYAVGTTDLDGRPRIVGGTVDIGACEFQGAGMGEFIAWLREHCLPTDGSADLTDPDADGHNNWQEWRAGTDPNDRLSLLRLLAPTAGAVGVVVRWQSVSGQIYSLERSTNLVVQAAFQTVATNIPGQPDTTSYTDTNAARDGPFFYRVEVKH